MFKRFTEIIQGNIRLFKVTVYRLCLTLPCHIPSWEDCKAAVVCTHRGSFLISKIEIRFLYCLFHKPGLLLLLLAPVQSAQPQCHSSGESVFLCLAWYKPGVRKLCAALNAFIPWQRLPPGDNHFALGAENILGPDLLTSWVHFFVWYMPMTTLEEDSQGCCTSHQRFGLWKWTIFVWSRETERQLASESD